MTQGCKILVIYNQKGGVGKTTTAYNLAKGIAKARPTDKILVVDFDGQRSLTRLSGVEVEQGVSAYIEGKRPLKDTIVQLEDNLYLMPSDSRLYTSTWKAPQTFKDDVADFSIVVVDMPPAYSETTYKMMQIADFVVTPCVPQYDSLLSVIDTIDAVKVLKARDNPELELLGVVTCCLGGVATPRIKKAILSQLGKVLSAEGVADLGLVRSCVAVEEARASKKSIYDYSPRCNAAKDYKAVVENTIKAILTR